MYHVKIGEGKILHSISVTKLYLNTVTTVIKYTVGNRDIEHISAGLGTDTYTCPVGGQHTVSNSKVLTGRIREMCLETDSIVPSSDITVGYSNIL